MTIEETGLAAKAVGYSLMYRLPLRISGLAGDWQVMHIEKAGETLPKITLEEVDHGLWDFTHHDPDLRAGAR